MRMSSPIQIIETVGCRVRRCLSAFNGWLIIAAIVCSYSLAHAQPTTPDSKAVAATVNGSPISVGEVERSVANTNRRCHVGRVDSALNILPGKARRQVR